MKKINITVVVVTKNRSQDLFNCLLSLVQQNDKDFQVNIINNNSTDDTKKVSLGFNKLLKIHHYLEKGKGYPVIYNAGIRTVKTEWVAFIDDDCIADKNWIKDIKEEVNQYPDTPAIIGYSDNFFPDNKYSCYMHFDHNLWQTKGTDSKTREVINYQILDNKNLALNIKVMKKYNVWFDESLCEFMNGRAEDGDFGMQLFSKGISLVYSNKMRIFHKEPQGLKSFIKKLTQKSLGTYLFTKKWNKHLPYIYQMNTINNREENQIKNIINIFNKCFKGIPFYNKFLFILLIPILNIYKNAIYTFAFRYYDYYYKNNPEKIKTFIKKNNLTI